MQGIAQRLYVGNIPLEVSPDMVYGILQEAGPVIDFALQLGENGVTHKGFGNVVYPNSTCAQRALNTLNGRQLMGRALKLSHPETVMGNIGTGMLGAGLRPGQPFQPPMPEPAPVMYGGAPGGFGPVAGMPMLQPPVPPPGPPPPGMQPLMQPMMQPPMLPPMPPMPPPMPPVQPIGPAGASSSAASAPAGPGALKAPASAPPSIRSALEAMSPGELWAILSELRGMAASQPEAAKQLLLQYPMLAHAIVHIQAMLGTLATPTQAYAAAVVANGGSGAPVEEAGSGVSAAPPAVDEEQKALVRSVLAMTDEDVAAMPAEQREGVEQIRMALRSPLDVLHSLDSPAREELLQLREQLTAVLAAL